MHVTLGSAEALNLLDPRRRPTTGRASRCPCMGRASGPVPRVRDVDPTVGRRAAGYRRTTTPMQEGLK